MKKVIKFLFIAFVVLAVLIAVGAFVLYKMYPTAKLKLIAQNYVEQNYHRQIDFTQLSLNIFGVTVKDLAISESTSFKQGTFVKAKKAVIKIQLRPLLDKKIKIDTVGFEGLDVNIVKNKNGSFNFDDLISAGAQSAQEQPADNSEGGFSYDVSADDIYLKNTNLNFENKQAEMSFTIKGANLTIKEFDFRNYFSVIISAATAIKTDSLDLSPINILLEGKVKLADFKMEDASAQITGFSVSYRNAALNMQGSVDNFAAPSFSLEGALKGIDSNLLSQFIPGPLTPFALPQVDVSVNGSCDIAKSFLKFTNAKVSIGNSYISAAGDLDYSSPQMKYNFSSKADVKLKEISDMAKETLSALNLQGAVDGALSVKSGVKAPQLNGSVNLRNVGAQVLRKELKNLNGVVTASGANNIRTNTLKGVFDGSDFTAFFSYVKPADAADITLIFTMDKYTLEDINYDTLFEKAPKDKTAKKEKPSADAAAGDITQKQETPRSIPMNINAAITIKEITNNVFSTQNLVIKADVKNVDNKFDRANGQITFSSQNGEIKDINKLMSSSIILKVIFTSVRVIQRAFNVLRLDKMTLGNDTIRYSLIEGAYSVSNGTVTIEKSDIYSDLTTVKSIGTIDLLTDKINMTVNSHFGKVTEGSGFRPVVIKIGGTLSDPSFKVDITSTVTSLFDVPGQVVKSGVKISTATVTGVGEAAGSIVKGIAGLFHKKSK